MTPGQQKSIFTKAMSVHTVSPALSLQAIFQKKLASHAGKKLHQRRGREPAVPASTQHLAVCCCSVHDMVAEVRHAADALLLEVGFPLPLSFLRGIN